jgi:solute:Na+ symporter, SSS family
MALNIIVLVIYLAALLYIGYKAISQCKNFDDFAIARGIIPWPVLMATAAATYMGGGATLISANLGSAFGYVIFWVQCGLAISFILSGFYLAPLLKRYTGARTVADIIGLYSGHTPRVTAGFLSLIFMVGILGTQIFSFGVVLNAFLNVPMTTGIIIGMGVVILYTMAGGLFAVIHTDILQFVILAIFIPLVLLIMTVQGSLQPGGMTAILSQVSADHFTLLGGWPLPAFLSLFFMLLLGETLSPYYTVRIFSSKSPIDAKKGLVIGGFFMLIFMFITASIGLLSSVIYPNIGGDALFPTIIMQALPVGLSGIAIAALFAALMSTSDSTLAVSSVIFIEDILKPLSKKEFTDDNLLKTSRILTLIIGVLTVFFCMQFKTILDIFYAIYPIWGSAMLVPAIASIIWRERVSPYAVFASMIGGLVMAIIWDFVIGQPFGFTSILPGFIVSILIFIFVQALTASVVPVKGFNKVENYHVSMK